MMTDFLDGQAVKRVVNTSADATILTETDVLCFPHWKFKPDPLVSGVGGQQYSKITTHLIH